ncbi:paraquat-inducible protein A [Akkermansiaceae bacterium]|nr:paraquat-inducible protein A [Akkermansiaceae bacterium]
MLKSALQHGKVSCHVCAQVSEISEHVCNRCHAPLHSRKTDSVQRCFALLCASIIAYIPANVWPIMVVTQLGVTEASTILGGVALFWEMQAYPIATVIFIASVLIPGLKIAALAWLCALAKGWVHMAPRNANKIYWLTELVGRWSMVDVFVVAILVALIQMGNLMSIQPGAAAISFAIMVILTMLAAHSFDPRIIWDAVRKNTPSS